MRKKIELVDMKIDHIELIRAWRMSERVSKYMYTDPNISNDDQKKWFEAVSTDGTKKYFIINCDGIPCGVALLYNIDMISKKCYWAFYIGDENVANQKVGSTAEYLVLNFVFSIMKMNKLSCEVLTFNEKVISMHEKFGFRREGYFRDHVFKNGKYLDVVTMAILKHEWKRISNFFDLNFGCY